MKIVLRPVTAVLLLAAMCFATACTGSAPTPDAPDNSTVITTTLKEADGNTTPNDATNLPGSTASPSTDGNTTTLPGSDISSPSDTADDTDEEKDPIDTALGFAKKFVNSFGSVPDTWSFLPDSFAAENYVVDASQIPTYTNFVEVSSIPKNYIGKQMNVVVGLLNKCDTALEYVNTVYGVLNIIETSYQTFINDNPDNYKSFSGNAGEFTYNIVLDGKVYLISAEIKSVGVTLFADGNNSTYGARIQLTDTTALKYTVTQSGIKIALNVLNASSTQLEFIRSGDSVTGYIYEFLTIGGAELRATSTLLNSNSNYTTVVGTKGDFIPTADSRNCEVYNSKTGRLVSTEVRETLGDDVKTYDTLWYNLSDISGITSIRKVDEYNLANPDTIYINGKSEPIHSKLGSIIQLDTSRRFDIEFKKVSSYVLDAESGKYESVEYEVPMMFIQEDYFETFCEDYKEKNDITVTVKASQADRAAVHYGYHELIDIYDTIKALVTQQDIINYCSADFSIS